MLESHGIQILRTQTLKRGRIFDYVALVGRRGVFQHFAPRVAANALDTLIRTAVPELGRQPDAP